MSDVAMNDAAPAAADSSPAPEVVAEITNPISTEAQPEPREDDKPEPKAKPEKTADDKKPLSTRDALKKAADKVEADEKAKADPKAVKDDAKPDLKAKPEPARVEPKSVDDKGQPRTERGQFAPKEGTEAKPDTEAKPTNFAEAPQRFSPDAKTAWKDAPEPVRAEVHRAVKELEAGYQKHRGDAEAYATVKPYAELAQKQGTTLQAALSNYVAIEQRLKTDFIGGLEQLAQNRGTTLRAVAAQVMGQKPDEVAQRSDKVIGDLQREIATLKQQIGGVSKTIETQRSEATLSQVTAFATAPGHERFDELSPDIKFFLETGRAPNLEEAYALAERLNPGPAKQVPKPAAVPAAPTAQNRNGQKSISGAPSQGSAPAQRAPSKSIRDSLTRARAAAG